VYIIKAVDAMLRLYKLFIEKDATMVEINPLAEISTGEGKFISFFFLIYTYRCYTSFFYYYL